MNFTIFFDILHISMLNFYEIQIVCPSNELSSILNFYEA